MKNIILYNRKEFSKRIGISLENLRNKELNGELIPTIDQQYTSTQIEEYLAMKNSNISIFTQNISYLMKKHNLRPFQLAKLASVDVSTITRMLDGKTKYHKKSPVKKMSNIFGYVTNEEISNLEYRHIYNHQIIPLPIYTNLFQANFETFIKYSIQDADKQLLDEWPNCALKIPHDYIEFFEGSKYLLIILSSPLLEDTVIYLDHKKEPKLGCITKIERSTYLISEIIDKPANEIEKEWVFGIVKSNY